MQLTAIEFWGRIQLLTCIELEPIGVEPHYAFGAFDTADRLFEIVKQHPNLHIVSAREPTFMNRYEPECEMYFLASGDSDPALERVTERLTPESLAAYERKMHAKYGEKLPPEIRFGIVLFRNLFEGRRFLDGLITPEERQQVRNEAMTGNGSLKQDRKH